MESKSTSRTVDFAVPLIALGVLLALVYLHSLATWKARSRGRPLPPGPKPLPFLGNLFDVPKVKPWFGFRDLCAMYGDVVYFRSLNQRNVILGSPAVITEFLDKRAANSSDRLVSPTTRLTAIADTLGFMPYGPTWRDCRRGFWQHFHPGAISHYKPVQLAVNLVFLSKLADNPAHFKQHIRFTFAATILKIAYGIDVDDEDNELIKTVDAAIEGPGEVMVPGRMLVDHIPFLQYLPAWVPGAGFQKSLAKWREGTLKLLDLPFAQRNTAFTENLLPHCTPIVDSLLSKPDDSEAYDSKLLVKTVAGAIFVAGADTTFATLQATFLAMSLYPEVQKKAQAELDAVVGPNRLPDFEDRESLPYVNAIVKESLRWFNVAPLGISHRTMEDDEFHGYFIPAGTNLVANIWACMHDPMVYEDPYEYCPERFMRDGKLDPTVRDPFSFVFGFGRRICPGRYFADAALFLNIASVLHVFNFTPPLDDNGNPIKVEFTMSDGFLSYPEDCRCTIKPRSPQAVALLSAA